MGQQQLLQDQPVAALARYLDRLGAESLRFLELLATVRHRRARAESTQLAQPVAGAAIQTEAA